MNQKILDPSLTRDAIGISSATQELPKRVREEFGFVPDETLWLPGDLLLFNAEVPSAIQRLIIARQGKAFSFIHARWHHAAIYLGHSRICEATLTGVGVSSIFKYVPRNRIRVRRCPILAMAQNQQQRYEFVIQNLSRMTRLYSLTQILSVFWASVLGWWRVQYVLAERGAHICSHLYANSYAHVTKRNLTNPSLIATPAHLSITPELVDVPSRWIRTGD